MPDEKICPKCKTVMGHSPYVCAIPAAVPPGMTNTAINPAMVYPVAPYACPKCHYVELYYVELQR
jgi:hypothetical protein